MIISGQGFPPNTSVVLDWSTANATWNVGGTSTPEVLGINTVPGNDVLAHVLTNGTGSFSQTVTVPVDNNGQHVIGAVVAGSNAPLSQAVFTLEPSFYFSPTSGPVGTPVTVYASGLGAHLYAVAYHVLFDNQYLGYMTGVTTHGQGNFTFYVTGIVGPHTISVYNGYPGPAYLNSNQAPASVSITSYDPPLIPFHGQFTITAPDPSTQASGAGGASMILPILSLALVIGAFVMTPIMAFQKKKNGNGFLTSGLGKIRVIVVIAALLIVGAGAYLAFNDPSTLTTTQTTTQTVTLTSAQTITQSSTPTTAKTTSTTAGYVPQATVIRPQITLPQITATSGPRMTVTPNIAPVGTVVNVTGLGFPPNTITPLSWATHIGSHVTSFVSAIEPLRNVTTNAAGSFSFTMKVPYDLGGLHNITAPNVAPNGNATLYIERSASISASQGLEGSIVTITMTGMGWTYQDNIAAVDYDNSFIGYVCGFNTNGNITLYLPVTGAPGYHTIDLYPSNYLGPTAPNATSIAIYRYPILTPYDGPAAIPVFHFSFLITSGSQS